MNFRRRQRGQAFVEYLYVVPILCLLVLGAIQFGFIYQAKATLNYATFLATREGALNNGSMDKIKEGLTSGLMPLFAHSSNTNGRNLSLLKSAWNLAKDQVQDTTITQVKIVNPTEAAFSAYQSESMSGDEIPNDNLMYRSTDIFGGGMNIQDANILKVRVTYCFKMSVPILNKMIFHLIDNPTAAAPGSSAADMIASSAGGGASRNRCAAIPDEYRIPITAESVVRMQSPFQNPNPWITSP